MGQLYWYSKTHNETFMVSIGKLYHSGKNNVNISGIIGNGMRGE